METLTLELPAMYGDHHVVEVRQLLLKLPGVKDVYASSSFQIVEVQYDEGVLDPALVHTRLEEAGYTGELPIPHETDTPATESNGKKPFFRHTSAYEQTKQTVSFAQRVPYQGRPLWPCPGMGAVKTTEEETTNG